MILGLQMCRIPINSKVSKLQGVLALVVVSVSLPMVQPMSVNWKFCSSTQTINILGTWREHCILRNIFRQKSQETSNLKYFLVR